MTVTLTPRPTLHRRDIYSGITRVVSDGAILWLHQADGSTVPLALSTVAAIALDDHGGALD